MNSSTRRSLQRSRKDRMIAGVCGGIAEATGLDPAIVRLLAVLLVLSSMGSGLVIYLILALVMPEAPAVAISQAPAAAVLERDAAQTSAAASAASAASAAELSASSETGATPSTEVAPAFTADEVRRWDLPGEAAAGAGAAATTEEQAASTTQG